MSNLTSEESLESGVKEKRRLEEEGMPPHDDDLESGIRERTHLEDSRGEQQIELDPFEVIEHYVERVPNDDHEKPLQPTFQRDIDNMWKQKYLENPNKYTRKYPKSSAQRARERETTEKEKEKEKAIIRRRDPPVRDPMYEHGISELGNDYAIAYDKDFDGGARRRKTKKGKTRVKNIKKKYTKKTKKTKKTRRLRKQ